MKPQQTSPQPMQQQSPRQMPNQMPRQMPPMPYQMPQEIPPMQLLPTCPPGLEPLIHTESVWVHQQIDMLEVFLPVEEANKYKITDSAGNQLFFAVERSGFFSRQFLGEGRPFRIDIIDNYGRLILYVERPLTACEEECTVFMYDGSLLGKITFGCCAFWLSEFKVRDQSGDEAFHMRGPPCGCSVLNCCLSAAFDIFPVNSKKAVGQIRKEYSGFQEMYSNADTFGVEFPLDMDVRMKGVFIGAVFLIDFTYYEKQPNRSHRRY